MSVYVDGERNPLGRMIMCHMIADTPRELRDMAEEIGLLLRWYQPRSFPHFDVALGRRALAVDRGAVEVTRRELVAHMKRIRASQTFKEHGRTWSLSIP